EPGQPEPDRRGREPDDPRSRTRAGGDRRRGDAGEPEREETEERAQRPALRGHGASLLVDQRRVVERLLALALVLPVPLAFLLLEELVVALVLGRLFGSV